MRSLLRGAVRAPARVRGLLVVVVAVCLFGPMVFGVLSLVAGALVGGGPVLGPLARVVLLIVVVAVCGWLVNEAIERHLDSERSHRRPTPGL